jgi:cyanophycinase
MPKAKGFLVPIGGAEDKGVNYKKESPENQAFDFFKAGILSRVLRLIGHFENPRIELITTASSMPDVMEKTYYQSFNTLGCSNIGHLLITNRDQADTTEHLERVNNCHCIIFTGGDQLRLSTILGGTKLLTRIKNRYLKDPFVVVGTSAGAMAMSNTMIYDGDAQRAHLRGEIKFTTGFGFVTNIIIDTHFEKRGRFNRLAQAVAVQPGILGIGLAEDTGVIISPGNKLEVIGSGIITIVNGKSISYTNLADIDDGMPISVEHMVVHILSCGEIYNISTQQVERNGQSLEM